MGNPFITFYTPTYNRPLALSVCIQSVAMQTISNELEQIIIPDFVGRGVGGMFKEIPKYVNAVNGDYIHILADDDELVGVDVCEKVKEFAQEKGNPPLIIVHARKDGVVYPNKDPYPPAIGHIDLGCFVVRSDVWKTHVHCYGDRYEGDFDFINSLYDDGVEMEVCGVLFEQEGETLDNRNNITMRDLFWFAVMIISICTLRVLYTVKNRKLYID